jgi:hypothetical protein
MPRQNADALETGTRVLVPSGAVEGAAGCHSVHPHAAQPRELPSLLGVGVNVNKAPATRSQKLELGASWGPSANKAYLDSSFKRDLSEQSS